MKRAHEKTRRALTGGILAVLTCVSAGESTAKPTDFDHAKLARTAMTDFIQPGYRHLGGSVSGLERAIRSLCVEPSKSNLQHARRAFSAVIAAWGRIEIITFGPIAEENRFERVFFWPDRRGIGGRQIRTILSSKPDRAIRPTDLAGMSVAVQGLTALEQLLYGTRSGELATSAANGFRCRYARSIVGNLRAIVDDLAKEWAADGAFAKVWLNPGPDNLAYLSSKETTHELVKMLDQGLEMVRDQRVAPAIGMGPTRKVMRPVLWRSKLSMVLIDANIRGLRDLLFKAGLVDAALASAGDENGRPAAAFDGVRSELSLTLQMSGKLARETDLFARPDIRSRLIPIGFPLKNIRNNAIGLLKTAAGLSVGFNASDGD